LEPNFSFLIYSDGAVIVVGPELNTVYCFEWHADFSVSFSLGLC
jgi:hypothetical protein